MWYDLISLSIFAFFIVSGARRGLLRSAFGLLVLICAYTAAIFGAKPLAPVASALFPKLGLFAMPIGGSIAFLFTFCVLGTLALVLSTLEKRHRENNVRSLGDRFGGALFGAIRGGFILLLLGILGNYLGEGQQVGFATQLPSLDHSRVSNAAGTIAQRGVKKLLGESTPSAKLTAQLAIHPAGTATALQTLMENPRVLSLREDSTFWSRMQHGEIDSAMNRLAFRQLAYDDAFRQRLAELGIIDAETAADPEIFKQRVREAYAEIAPRVQRLKRHPAVRKLMASDEVLALARGGNISGLLMHPDFVAAVQVILGDLPQQANSAHATAEMSDNQLARQIEKNRIQPKTGGRVEVAYMYKDDQGSIRFVDDLRLVPKKFRNQVREVALSSGNYGTHP